MTDTTAQSYAPGTHPDLPPPMTEEYQEATASGRPNGINVPGVPLSAPLFAN